jgi:hypothetical protein
MRDLVAGCRPPECWIPPSSVLECRALLELYHDLRASTRPGSSARASAPDHAYYAQVMDRKDGKRAALAEARKIVRRAGHILSELGDDALAAV